MSCPDCERYRELRAQVQDLQEEACHVTERAERAEAERDAAREGFRIRGETLDAELLKRRNAEAENAELLKVIAQVGAEEHRAKKENAKLREAVRKALNDYGCADGNSHIRMMNDLESALAGSPEALGTSLFEAARAMPSSVLVSATPPKESAPPEAPHPSHPCMWCGSEMFIAEWRCENERCGESERLVLRKGKPVEPAPSAEPCCAHRDDCPYVLLGAEEKDWPKTFTAEEVERRVAEAVAAERERVECDCLLVHEDDCPKHPFRKGEP